MFIIESYSTAIIFCIITMLCWGSWANTQKLSPQWRFELFYWDYVIGIVLFTVLFGLTAGSVGDHGRAFIDDLQQGSTSNFASALLGGIIFNAANILLSAAIAIAGMSVAFPVGIGLALVIGVIVNYVDAPLGNPLVLFSGVLCIAIAIGMNAYAFRKNSTRTNTSTKGLLLSVISGSMMGLFYNYVAASMATDFSTPEALKLTPYSALFIFSIGVFTSNFIFNSLLMKFPITGTQLTASDYFRGGFSNHFIGILGGLIWAWACRSAYWQVKKQGRLFPTALVRGQPLWLHSGEFMCGKNSRARLPSFIK